MTSWWATMPRMRTEWTRIPAAPAPPRAPATTSSVVGSGAHSDDAAAMRATVASAVPDGASALLSWCSSMTSAVSKNGAAISAKRIISTAEIEKLAATTQFGPPRELGAEHGRGPRRSARSCRRRRGCRASPATARCARAAAATVKSTTTSAPASANAFGSPAIVEPLDRARRRRAGRPRRRARAPGRRPPPRTPSRPSARLPRDPDPHAPSFELPDRAGSRTVRASQRS